MEKHGPNDIQHGGVSDLERRGVMSATFTIDEKAEGDDKEVAIVGTTNPDQDPTSASRKLVSVAVLDTFLLLSILFMLAWPWTLFVVFRAKGGVQVPRILAESIVNDAIVFTLLGTFNRIFATFLFGCAITRYGQERVAEEGKPITVFGVSALLAFRHMSLVWGGRELLFLFRRARRLALLASLVLCLAAFALIPSGTTGLLTPEHFHKTSPLTGKEVDFTSIDTDCVTWLGNNSPDILFGCEKGSDYHDCLGDAVMTDALSSGRKNMDIGLGPLSQQPMTDEFVLFQGSFRGVLPIGPDGFENFRSELPEWDGSFPESIKVLNYSYTLTQQGLESQVNCAYDHESPIRYIIGATSGTCDPNQGLRPMLKGLDNYPLAGSLATWNLSSWACASTQSSRKEPSDTHYVVYLRGAGGYAESIANITCTLSNFRSRDYDVTYTRSDGYFTAKPATPSPEPNAKTLDSFAEGLINALELLIWASQTETGNLVAEAVLNTGRRFFNLPMNATNDRFPRLVEGFMQGALEYYDFLGNGYTISCNLRAPGRSPSFQVQTPN
ncbi:hypothetical protein MD484_g7638, partial [Candolleomyces efflorescens]